MGKIKKILIAIGVILVAWLIGYVIGRNHISDVTGVIQIDTLVRYDTIQIEKPAEIRYKKLTQTILVPVSDTIVMHDSIFVPVQKEVKEYKDSLYYARVSGYHPSLDYIEVYPKVTTISKTETIVQDRPQWHYSLDLRLDYGQVGYKYIQPGIGAEVGYKKWAIGAAVGLNVELENNTLIHPNFCWNVGMKYNFLGK